MSGQYLICRTAAGPSRSASCAMFRRTCVAFVWLCMVAGTAPVCSVSAEPLPPFAAESVPFMALRAGSSGIAQVEAQLGKPLSQSKPDMQAYSPPSGVGDIDIVQVEYFPDSRVVARLDAWLKVPIPVAELRARFGKAALQQTRKDGRQEEFFFPRLTGLIANKDQPDLAVAISYLSARALSDAFCEKSQQFNREQRYAESKEPADNAVRVDPDYARAYLVQGIHHYYQKDFNEAMVSFVAATHAKYPSQKIAHAHVWLGTLYWQKKMQPKKAREEFSKALAIAPDFGSAYLEYGRFLKAQKELDGAIDAFAKVTQLDQAPHEARMELARIHFERKEWSKALPYLVHLVDWVDKGGKPTNQALSAANIYALYGYTLSAIRGKRDELLGDDGSSAKIVDAYEKSIGLNPKVPSWVFEELGHEYFDDADLGRAEASYRKGLALEPRHLGLNQKLADVLLALQRYEEARRQAEFALSLAPNNTWQMMNIARAYALLDKRQEAMAWLRKAGAAGYQAQYIGSLMLEDGIFDKLISEDELQRLLPGRR